MIMGSVCMVCIVCCYLMQLPLMMVLLWRGSMRMGDLVDDLRLVLVRVRAVKAKREPLSGVCTSSAQPGASLLLFRDISSLVRGGGDGIRAYHNGNVFVIVVGTYGS